MQNVKVLAQNKKAGHEYFIEDRYEAGIVLVGTEVKSCRLGKANLRDSYIQIKRGEAFIINMHISPYEKGNIMNREPLRTRKLLLNKREILKLQTLTAQKGFTIVPLKMYLKNNKVKLEIGVAKGKHLYDKRHTLKEKTIKRDIDRAIIR